MGHNRNSGIYLITCLSNKTVYVGQAVDLHERLWRHKNHLKNKKHGNVHLQRAYDKYGVDNFKFEILQEVNQKFLTSYEISYWSYYKSLIGGVFNIKDPRPSTKLSPETLLKIGDMKRGNQYAKGYRAGPEELKLRSDSHKGFRGCLGKKASQQTKDKMSASHKLRHAIKQRVK